jgi:hypothetical protein
MQCVVLFFCVCSWNCLAAAGGTATRRDTDVQLPDVQNQWTKRGAVDDGSKYKFCHVGTVALFDGPQFLDLERDRVVDAIGWKLIMSDYICI